MKQMKLWAMKTGSKTVLPYSIRTTRKQAIDGQCKAMNEDWKTLKSWGYTAVKVSVVERT